MNCKYCGKSNAEGALFCMHCGNPVEQQAQQKGSGVRLDPNGYPILDDSGEGLGASKTAKRIAVGSTSAIEKDLKGLRPLTRAAYYVVRSDNTAWLRFGLYAGFTAVCVVIIGVLIAIYNEMNILVQSAISNGAASTGLRDIYAAQVGESFSGLIWLTVLLTALIFVYVMIGRLILRIKKVKRKRKKIEQRDMV